MNDQSGTGISTLCSRRRALKLVSASLISSIAAPVVVHANGFPNKHDVIAYGAKPDASADATAAFNKALAAIATAGGGVLVIPPGTYLILGNVVYAGSGPLTVVGSGQNVSTLRIATPAGAAFAIKPTTNSANVTMRDIGFLPSGGTKVVGCTALAVAFPSVTISPGLVLENVDFGPFMGGTTAFQTAISLVNVGRGQLRNVSAHGNFPNGPQAGTTFLTMSDCIDLRLNNVSFDNLDVGVLVAGYCEGLHLNDCVVIANHGIQTGYGKNYNTGAGVPINLLGLYISNCEFNTGSGALELYQVNSGWMTGTHFGSAGGLFGITVALWGSTDLHFSGCSITGAFNGASNIITGAYLASSATVAAARNQFDDVSFQNISTGIGLTSNAFDNTGRGLRMYSFGLGALVGTPYLQGSVTMQAVSDKSGTNTNIFEWIATTPAANHATDHYLYNQTQ